MDATDHGGVANHETIDNRRADLQSPAGKVGRCRMLDGSPSPTLITMLTSVASLTLDASSVSSFLYRHTVNSAPWMIAKPFDTLSTRDKQRP